MTWKQSNMLVQARAFQNTLSAHIAENGVSQKRTSKGSSTDPAISSIVIVITVSYGDGINGIGPWINGNVPSGRMNHVPCYIRSMVASGYFVIQADGCSKDAPQADGGIILLWGTFT